MTDENQQTTDVGTETAGGQPDAATQAGDTLDAFLSSFEDQESPPETPKQPEPTASEADRVRQELADLKKWKEDEETRRQTENTNRLVGDLVSEMKNAVEMEGISDAFIRRYLIGAAQDDHRWGLALSDPKSRTRAIRELAEAVKGEFGSVSESKTASERKAVKESVRGLSTTPPEDAGKPISNAEFEAMTDGQKRQYLAGQRKAASLRA